MTYDITYTTCGSLVLSQKNFCMKTLLFASTLLCTASIGAVIISTDDIWGMLSTLPSPRKASECASVGIVSTPLPGVFTDHDYMFCASSAELSLCKPTTISPQTIVIVVDSAADLATPNNLALKYGFKKIVAINPRSLGIYAAFGCSKTFPAQRRLTYTEPTILGEFWTELALLLTHIASIEETI